VVWLIPPHPDANRGGGDRTGLAYRTTGTGAPWGAPARRHHGRCQTCANKKPRVKMLGAAMCACGIRDANPVCRCFRRPAEYTAGWTYVQTSAPMQS